MKYVLTVVAVFCCAAIFGNSSKLLADPFPDSEAVGPEDAIVATDLAGRRQRRGEAQPLFRSLSPQETGIDFVSSIDLKHAQRYLYVGGYASPGLALGDINGDGLLDLFVSGGAVQSRLYLQRPGSTGEATLRFEDVTESLNLGGGDAWSAGVALVDIDQDGDLDIYVCNYDSANFLYLNQLTETGELRFVESASRLGLDLVDACFMPAFCDFDRDGDLDVAISAYQYINPSGRPEELPVVQRGNTFSVLPEFEKYYGIVIEAGKQTFRNIGRQDYLLENLQESGSTVFRDVTQQAGLADVGVGNSILWWDYNGDGWPDLYVGNDFKAPDCLYRNNRNGTFTDVVAEVFPHTTWFSMGSDAGDVNNDGLFDLFVSDMAGTSHYRSKVTMGEMGVHRPFMETAFPAQYMRNSLMINTGTDRFMEAAFMAGIASSDWTWSVKFADFDNDGRIDLYVTNGAARMFNHADRNFSYEQRVGKTQWELWEDTPPRLEQNLAFRNAGDFQFEDNSKLWGLDKSSMSYAAVSGDLDNDGDLDLIVVHLDEPLEVLRNDSHQGRVCQVRLRGTTSNRSGLGAVVRILTEAGQQVRQAMPSSGFLSYNAADVHFGLGDSQTIRQLSVEWPSGIVQQFGNLPVDHRFVITEHETPRTGTDELEQAIRSVRSIDQRWFRPAANFPALRHQETKYDDYARQPLLPYAHSQLGPGVAVADVDGDGDLDVYAGRARGSRRAVYENQGTGRLGVKSILPGAELYEDMSAIFLDADKDGDVDLYVVSGSVECDENDESLRDRLYLNNGQGQFQVAPKNALPDLRDSGSAVCAVDYDRDGDLDLFVGSRLIPGRYPATPHSRLLRNDSEPGSVRFVDATDEVSLELRQTGLVTGAVWCDADGDGWADLMVAHEWGPVKLYRNEAADDGSRRLVNRTSEAGLQDKLGWWNGVVPTDLDNDGDLDLVATNFGWNTKYHASEKKPELLYYGDFDDSGKADIVEAKFEATLCVPRRGLSCSSHAMPFIRDKVGTFHNFGLSTLEDIYTPERLEQSVKLKANCLDSGVWINEGTAGDSSVPRFRFQPLPALAQIAPAFGAAVSDFNGDGWLDIVLAQNFFSPQIETGRMNGGLSLLLAGRGVDSAGNVQFEPIWPGESGIRIVGDAMAASTADFSGDGWPDLLISVNDGVMEAYVGRTPPNSRALRVDFGKSAALGNANSIGALVRVDFSDQSSMVRTVSCGSGYLSQSQISPVFCYPAEKRPARVSVRWANGQVTQRPLSELPDYSTSGAAAISIFQAERD